MGHRQHLHPNRSTITSGDFGGDLGSDEWDRPDAPIAKTDVVCENVLSTQGRLDLVMAKIGSDDWEHLRVGRQSTSGLLNR